MTLFTSTAAIWGIVLPPLIVAGVSLLSKIRRASKLRSPKGLGILTFIASLFSLIFSIALVLSILGSPSHVLQGTFLIFQYYIDALSAYFIILVNSVALFASFSTLSFSGRPATRGAAAGKPASLSSFHWQFNVFHLSMLLVPLADNLIFLWVLITFTTVISAPLIGYRGDRPALEAAWKYIMISSTGIVFALLGTLFLVSALKQPAASTNFSVINWSGLVHYLTGSHTKSSPAFIELSFLLILLGYGTKAGLFPMHTWLPDGHGEAPPPVSALLSGVLLKCALYVILRFYVITNLALGPENSFASEALLIAGTISLLMAVPFILNTKSTNRFKRVLAYHSLEHMGIITFGFGLGIPLAFFGALLHSLNHALTKALMFLTYGNIQDTYKEKKIEEDAKIRGVFQVMPLNGLLLALGGLALVGMPPFNIFFSEFTILWAALQPPLGPLHILTVSLFLASVTLIFAGLVVHLGRILLGDNPSRLEKTQREATEQETAGHPATAAENRAAGTSVDEPPQSKIWERRLPVLPRMLLLLILLYLGFTTFPLTTLLQQSVQILSQRGHP
jgi:hydrogenase-4 component F